MKRVVYLAVVALVAMMLFVPAALAQGTQPKAQPKMEETMMVERTAPLPPSGGPEVGAVLLPAAALLIGSGVLGYAILRQRRQP